METIGFFIGVILITIGLFTWNRPTHLNGNVLMLYLCLFIATPLLCAVCGLLWLNTIGVVGIRMNLFTGIILGLIIGTIEFFWCLFSEAKPGEEAIGGPGLAIFSLFFNVVLGAILGFGITSINQFAQIGMAVGNLLGQLMASDVFRFLVNWLFYLLLFIAATGIYASIASCIELYFEQKSKQRNGMAFLPLGLIIYLPICYLGLLIALLLQNSLLNAMSVLLLFLIGSYLGLVIVLFLYPLWAGCFEKKLRFSH